MAQRPSDFSKDFDFYDASPEGFDIFSWCPTPEPTVPPTQVHLHIPVGKARIVMRFKGPGTLDRLINTLIQYREEVWGKRPTSPPSTPGAASET